MIKNDKLENDKTKITNTFSSLSSQNSRQFNANISISLTINKNSWHYYFATNRDGFVVLHAILRFLNLKLN